MRARQPEHNRELLVLAYLSEPSRELLGEILQAFAPICRAHALRLAKQIRGEATCSGADLRQDAAVKLLELLAVYKPQGASFERFLHRGLFCQMHRKNYRARRALRMIRPLPEGLDDGL